MVQRIFFLVAATVLLIIFSTPAQALWLSGYEYRKEITIDHTKIGSDLSSFPLAVILSDTTNIVDGNDVKFTSSDGETLLSYEKEKYAVNDGVYWVNLPTVSSGTDTTFYMYYGKEGDTDESTTNVWDSNYKMVQHLEETSGILYDSTSNANNGTPYGGVSQNVPGHIDGADSFDGNNDYVDVTTNTSMRQSSAITYSFWAKIPSGGGGWTMGAGANGGHGYGGVILTQSTLAFQWTPINPGTDTAIYDTDLSLPADQWIHVTVAVDFIGKTSAMYINGQPISTAMTQSPTNWVPQGSYSTGRTDAFGARYVNSWNYFNGSLDEIRVSNIARNSNWIESSYYSESNTLLSFGNQEGGVIPEPASLLLLGFGVIGTAFFSRRRKIKHEK